MGSPTDEQVVIIELLIRKMKPVLEGFTFPTFDESVLASRGNFYLIDGDTVGGYFNIQGLWHPRPLSEESEQLICWGITREGKLTEMRVSFKSRGAGRKVTELRSYDLRVHTLLGQVSWQVVFEFLRGQVSEKIKVQRNKLEILEEIKSSLVGAEMRLVK